MNIEKMTLAQLTEMLRKVESEIPKAKAREAAAVREQMRQMIKERGLTVQDVLSALGKSTRERVVPVKYRDPKTGAEWSGRGRRPHWYDPNHPKRFQVAA